MSAFMIILLQKIKQASAIDYNATDVLIYDNSIIGNYQGIETQVLARSSIISNNTISNNNGEGLYLSLNNSDIYNNIISK